MSMTDLTSLAPYIIMTATSVMVMLMIAFYRNHRLTMFLTLAGFALSAASIFFSVSGAPREVTALLVIDRYALFYMLLVLAAGAAIAALSYAYLERHDGHHEEFYLLVVLASLGCMVLAAASHFASFFLGIEILSVSLYAMAGYLRHSDRSVEAGVKYLILAAVSSAFILFGMALIYAAAGSMEFTRLAQWSAAAGNASAGSAGAGNAGRPRVRPDPQAAAGPLRNCRAAEPMVTGEPPPVPAQVPKRDCCALRHQHCLFPERTLLLQVFLSQANRVPTLKPRRPTGPGGSGRRSP